MYIKERDDQPTNKEKENENLEQASKSEWSPNKPVKKAASFSVLQWQM